MLSFTKRGENALNPFIKATESGARTEEFRFRAHVLDFSHMRQSLIFPVIVPTGRRDSSGIRLHYTPSLRRYDAAIMELGLVYTPIMAAPPKQRAFDLSGYCTSKCTQTVRIRARAHGCHTCASE